MSELKKLIISVRRHEKPQKDPQTGASLDKLTSKGIDNSRRTGSKLVVPNGGVVGFHSPKYSAWETITYMLEGAGLPTIVFEDELLDTMLMTQEFKDLAFVNPQSEKRPYDEVVQYMMDNSDPKGETFEQTGAKLQDFIRDAYFTLQNVNSSEMRVEAVSHGPKVEAGVINILKSLGNKITHVSQIGGGFSPGTGFTVNVEYNAKSGVYTANLEHRDQVYHNISLQH